VRTLVLRKSGARCVIIGPASRIAHSTRTFPINAGTAFWLILTVGGAVLIGVMLAYALISKRRRR
jgi:hypothetical protein